MDSNDAQFKMWNDFDLSLVLLHQSFWVNELFPILIVFNRFNPSILNVCTEPKHSLPISIDSREIKLDRFINGEFPNALLPILMDCRLGRSNH